MLGWTWGSHSALTQGQQGGSGPRPPPPCDQPGDQQMHLGGGCVAQRVAEAEAGAAVLKCQPQGHWAVRDKLLSYFLGWQKQCMLFAENL